MDTASTVQAHGQRLRERAQELKAMDPARIGEALIEAMRGLARWTGQPAVELRQAIQEETGLAAELIEWGLDRSLASFERNALERLLAQCEGDAQLQVVSPELTAVILAGNVFTAALRAVALPLLARSPVLVKAPTGGAALVSAMIDALDAVDEVVSDQVRLVTFGRDDQAATGSLLRVADTVAVYGDDQTLCAIRGLCPARTRIVPHGHGVSAAYVPRGALADRARVRAVARRLANDVVAYDQLGCLSPQVVLVQSGGVVDTVGFAGALHEALDELEPLLPRGLLPKEVLPQIAQWRGVAAARGTVFQGAGHLCAAESGALRLGPGYRHVGVYGCAGVGDLGQKLRPMGGHLKSLGVAGGVGDRTEVALSLPTGLAPRICPIGTMQTPPLDAYFDGLPPFAGLLSYVQVA